MNVCEKHENEIHVIATQSIKRCLLYNKRKLQTSNQDRSLVIQLFNLLILCS